MIDLVERTDWFKASILPHQAALRARLRRSLPPEADLDDLVSETLARAYAAEDWGRVANGRHYLFRIARNMLVDAARRDAIAPFDLVPHFDDRHEDWTTETTISARDELRQVQRAIDGLPQQCRRVFVLRRVHERSIGEIAEEMGLSISTVEKHLAKALMLVSRAIAEIEESGSELGRVDVRRSHDARGDSRAFFREAAR
jgi:RNA polymerase sigma-70 factor (ECF subfamily)